MRKNDNIKHLTQEAARDDFETKYTPEKVYNIVRDMGYAPGVSGVIKDFYEELFFKPILEYYQNNVKIEKHFLKDD